MPGDQVELGVGGGKVVFAAGIARMQAGAAGGVFATGGGSGAASAGDVFDLSSATLSSARTSAAALASSLSAFYTNHLGKPQLSGAIAFMSLAISFW